jgi:membrane-bound serine protease (ClpP class)
VSLTLALAVSLLPVEALATSPGEVFVLTIDDAITTATGDYIERAIQLAETESAEAVVILLDTPGGYVDTTLKIMEALENSSTPVIVYIWPRGGMAASAGTLIALAASGAAMAPRTTIGAAHPVASGDSEVDPVSMEKLVNVLVEHAAVFAARRGQKAVDWAESAIRESMTANEEEALDLGLIDTIAEDLDDLLSDMDGRTVPLGAAEKTLHTADAVIRSVPMSAIEKLLSALINPNIAFILLALGIQLILIEVQAPGGWVAGFTGALCLALAAYAMRILPLNWLGLALFCISFVLFVLDLKTPGIEALTFAGVLTLIAGALMLFNTGFASPYGRVSIPLVVITGLIIGALFALVVGVGLRAQRMRPVTGADSVVGRPGVVKTPLDPEGTVWVAGEEWTARADETPVESGESVDVVGIDGLRLRVRRRRSDSSSAAQEEQ